MLLNPRVNESAFVSRVRELTTSLTADECKRVLNWQSRAPAARRRTPLHCAVVEGRIECVRVLLDAKAYVNAYSGQLETPLELTVATKDEAAGVAIAELLCARGASVSAYALERAIATHRFKLMRAMLAHLRPESRVCCSALRYVAQVRRCVRRSTFAVSRLTGAIWVGGGQWIVGLCG